MSVTLGILGASPRITITVPQERGVDPIATMHAARRRFASYGAERVTLVPRREVKGIRQIGEGWAIKPQGLKKKEAL